MVLNTAQLFIWLAICFLLSLLLTYTIRDWGCIFPFLKIKLWYWFFSFDDVWSLTLVLVWEIPLGVFGDLFLRDWYKVAYGNIGKGHWFQQCVLGAHVLRYARTRHPKFLAQSVCLPFMYDLIILINVLLNHSTKPLDLEFLGVVLVFLISKILQNSWNNCFQNSELGRCAYFEDSLILQLLHLKFCQHMFLKFDQEWVIPPPIY